MMKLVNEVYSRFWTVNNILNKMDIFGNGILNGVKWFKDILKCVKIRNHRFQHSLLK